MTFYVTVTKKEPVRYLKASMQVRYWEDGIVNGQKDIEGKLIPFRNGDMWQIWINLKEGRIMDWPRGTTSNVHYKVCDAGSYSLVNTDLKTVIQIEGYVPSMLSPGKDGFGDYVIMDIDEEGMIANWKVDLKPFENK